MELRNRLSVTLILLLAGASFSFGQQSAPEAKKSNLPLLFSRLDMLATPSTPIDSPSKPQCQLSPSKMPIFCHIEHKMSQNSGIPIRIRLGNVQYVDQLEGKTKYTK